MKAAKGLLARRSELIRGGDPATTEEVRAVWRRLDTLAEGARAQFPLSDSAVAALRADLQRRVFSLHAAEIAAHECSTAAARSSAG